MPLGEPASFAIIDQLLITSLEVNHAPIQSGSPVTAAGQDDEKISCDNHLEATFFEDAFNPP